MAIRKQMKKLFGSQIFENLFNQTILYGFSHLIPLILLPFLINKIGVEKYGVINFSLAFGFYFQVVNEFGFDLSNVHHVVDNRENKRKLSEVLSAVLQCKFILLCVCTCIFFPIVLSVERFKLEILIYILAFIRMIGIVISPLWLFRSMEEIKYVTQITIPIKILLTLPIFLFVREECDYWWVMFFFAVEAVVSGIVALVVAIRHYDLRPCVQKFSVVKKYFVESVPFFITTFLYRIYHNTNPFVVGLLFGDIGAGIYTAAEKLVNAYSSFISPIISQVFYPYYQRVKNMHLIKRNVFYMSVGNIVILSIFYTLAHIFIGYFIHENVSEILRYFDMLLLVLALSLPNDLLGFPYLGVLGKAKEVSKSTLYATFSYFIVVGISILAYPSISLLIIALMVANIVNLGCKFYFINQSNKIHN